MARGRSRVGPYARSQMQKGIETSKSFGSGFSKILGGLGDVVSGAGQAASQAGSAAERMFNKPSVAPVQTKAPGTASGPASSASGSQPYAKATNTSNQTPIDAKVSSSTNEPKPSAAPSPGTTKPTVASTSTTSKSGYYKGGSQGDYTIKRGETLSGIAKRTGQSVADLAKMNKIGDVNKISSGAKLMTKVPTPPSRPADVSSAPTPAPKPETPAPAAASNVGGSDKTVGRYINTTNNDSVMNPGRSDKIGSFKKTPIQQQEPTPTSAARQTFDTNRQSPGSTADLAKSISPSSEPSTSMPKPDDENKSKFTNRVPMQESVQVGDYKYRII